MNLQIIKATKENLDLLIPNEVQYLEREHNPHIEAFGNGFRSSPNTCMYLELLAENPLLSKHTMTVIDYLLENPQPI